MAEGRGGQPHPPSLAEVIAQADKGIQRVRRTPQLAYSFLRHAGLSVSEPIDPTPKALLEPWVGPWRSVTGTRASQTGA